MLAFDIAWLVTAMQKGSRIASLGQKKAGCGIQANQGKTSSTIRDDHNNLPQILTARRCGIIQ